MIKQRVINRALWAVSLGLILSATTPAMAETIIIGKGTGIVWEGLPFNNSLTATFKQSDSHVSKGLLAVSNTSTAGLLGCRPATMLRQIGGYLAYPVPGMPGVGLIPRASGIATYYISPDVSIPGEFGSLTGTIGLPETRGVTTGWSDVVSPDYAWCLPATTSSYSLNYFKIGTTRNSTLSGTWVLVADGSQKSSQGTLPRMFFASYAGGSYGQTEKSTSAQILPSNITLRVSTLECSVNTPTAINFGAVLRNTQANAELAVISLPLIVSCGQASDQINANINLQFRAISGMYNNTASQLALNQQGGYVTGEIDKGITGSGNCNATTGLRFDNTPIKIGSIASTETSKTLNNQLTWRLCSGGSNLPLGPVTAAAEMQVTFN